MHAEAMLAAHPDATGRPDERLVRCIEACHDCAQACTACADSCLAEAEVAAQRRCIRLNLDCVDLCLAAAALLSRRTGGAPTAAVETLEACATACKLCGDECARHAGHMEHCRICAEACVACERACRDALAAQRAG